MAAITVDTAGLLSNLAIAGGALLAVAIAGYGWKKIVSFFGR